MAGPDSSSGPGSSPGTAEPTDQGWRARPPDSLDGMPPKRRRLVGWALGWYILAIPGLSLLRESPLPALVASLILAAVTAGVFIPLVVAERSETRRLRAAGLLPVPRPVTRRSLITLGCMAGVLWTAAIVVMVFRSELLVPLLPLAVTVYFGVEVKRWRRQEADGSGPTA